MRQCLFAAIVFGLVTAAWSCAVGAAEPVPAERRLPPETVQFLSVRHVPDFRKRVGESLLGRMLDDPAFWRYCDASVGLDSRKELGQYLDREFLEPIRTNAGMPPEKLLDFLQGEFAYAIVRRGPRNLALVMLIEVGDRAADIPDLREQIARILVDGEARFTERLIRGTPSTLVEPLKASAIVKPAGRGGFCVKDGFLILSSSEDMLDGILLRWDGRHPETLAASPDFAAIQKSCREGLNEVQLVWHFEFDLTRSSEDPWSMLGELMAALPLYYMVMTPLILLGGTDMPAIYFEDTNGGALGGTLSVSAGDYDFLNRIGARPTRNPEKPDDTLPKRPVWKTLAGGLLESGVQVPPGWIPADAARVCKWRWDVESMSQFKGDLPRLDQQGSSLVAAGGALCQLLSRPSAADNKQGRATHVGRLKRPQLVRQLRRLLRIDAGPLTGDFWLVELPPDKSGGDDALPAAVLAMKARDERTLIQSIAGLQGAKAIGANVKLPAGSSLWKTPLPKPSNRHLIYQSENSEESEREFERLWFVDDETEKKTEQQTCYMAVADSFLFLAETREAVERLLTTEVRPALADGKSYQTIASRLPATPLFVQYRQFSTGDLPIVGIQSFSDTAGAKPATRPDPASLQPFLKYFPPIVGFSETDGNDVRSTVFRLRERN